LMTPDSDPTPTFAALGLDPDLLEALTALGYEEPTPIQREAIPPLLDGRDLVGQAATGTGKTAAFALPLLQRLASSPVDGPERSSPSALVLVPTRELCMQVAEAVHRYGRAVGVRVLPVYGGQSFGQQLRVLKRGVDVVVATPGRALDHINRRTLDLSGLSVVVLDEADEMLDMGFADDLEAILAATPAVRQSVLFSATMPPRIAGIAARHLNDPVQIRIARERLAEGDVPQVRQTAYVVSRGQKLTALQRVLDLENPEAAIIFCRTRTEVDELTEKLNAHGYRTESMHGGMAQEQRDRVMKKLRSGTADLLVATDVAARGLDISRLTHVINYDLPNAPESYIHRIGRVGRAGREGVAISLAQPREHRLLKSIEQLTKRKIHTETVPTVADLRAHRLELLRASLREILLQDGSERYRAVVESLADEFDPMEIAMAAVKLARDASGGDPDDGDDGEDIPAPTSKAAPTSRATAKSRATPKSTATAKSTAPAKSTTSPKSRATGRSPAGTGAGAGGTRKAGAKPSPGLGEGVVRLYIGAGRDAGVRPQDLVGAITGEAGVTGGEIGAIEIGDRFSLVEVAEPVAAEVLQALRAAKIKGQKVNVRRER
jgi:ATP-dependent RNA helicase DeaD